MALSANTKIRFMDPPQNRAKSAHEVAGSVHIYAGAFVGTNPAKYLKPFEPGDRFRGIADEEFNNTSTTSGALSALGDDGERNKPKCRVITEGYIVYTLTGVTIADLGKPVYATADDALGFIGHPDAFVGWVDAKYDTNTAVIKLAGPLARPDLGTGVVLFDEDYTSGFAEVLTAGNEQWIRGLRYDSIGAGITTGAGISPLGNTAGTYAKMLLDNDNEAENLSIHTPEILSLSYGMTFYMKGRLATAGGAATDDLDFGIITAASSSITDAIRANIDVTTAGIKLAKFHLDANANDVFVGSDDDSSVVAATDTTIDNSTSADSEYMVIVRTSGVAEFWARVTTGSWARLLSSTAFSVGSSSTTYFSGFVNLEKSTGTGVPQVNIDRLRIGGASVGV